MREFGGGRNIGVGVNINCDVCDFFYDEMSFQIAEERGSTSTTIKMTVTFKNDNQCNNETGTDRKMIDDTLLTTCIS